MPVRVRPMSNHTLPTAGPQGRDVWRRAVVFWLTVKGIRIESRLPTVEEFKVLRLSVGWALPSDAAIARGLSGSVYGVCAVDDGVVVATGRIVGDGGFTYFIVDVMVAPHHRGLGIGTAVMKRLIEYIRGDADGSPYVTLMAARGVEGFYRRFGFETRPSDKYGPGMMLPAEKLYTPHGGEL